MTHSDAASSRLPRRDRVLRHVQSMPLLDGLLWLQIENVQTPGERVEPEEAFPRVPTSELERAQARVVELYVAAGAWGHDGMDALRRSQDEGNRYRADLEKRFQHEFPDFSMDSMITAYSQSLRANR